MSVEAVCGSCGFTTTEEAAAAAHHFDEHGGTSEWSLPTAWLDFDGVSTVDELFEEWAREAPWHVVVQFEVEGKTQEDAEAEAERAIGGANYKILGAQRAADE